MTASLSGGKRGGARRAGRYRPMAEINVTPLVDVMLVLLIIFMVTVPALSYPIQVDLPQPSTQPPPPGNPPERGRRERQRMAAAATARAPRTERTVRAADTAKRMGATGRDGDTARRRSR